MQRASLEAGALDFLGQFLRAMVVRRGEPARELIGIPVLSVRNGAAYEVFETMLRIQAVRETVRRAPFGGDGHQA